MASSDLKPDESFTEKNKEEEVKVTSGFLCRLLQEKVLAVWEMLKAPVLRCIHPSWRKKVMEGEGDSCCELSFCAGWPPPHVSGRLV